MDIHVDRRLIIAVLALAAGLLFTGCGTDNAESSPTITFEPHPFATATHHALQAGNADLTTTPPAATRSALVDIRQQAEVRVGVLYNYPPFSYLTSDGQVAGYEVELLRRIAALWEVEVTFVQVTRQTRIPMLSSGDVDLIAGAMPHRRDLEAFAEFSDSTFRSGHVVLVLSDSGLQSIAQIGEGPVGVLSADGDAAFAQYAAQHSLAPNVQVFNDVGDAATALKQGTVSAIVGRREVLMLASMSVENSTILNEFVVVEPYAFAVRRGDTPLRDLINLTLQQVTSESSFVELFNESFYGYGADIFPLLPGEASYSFQDFPATITAGESGIDRIRGGDPIRVGGMVLNSDAPMFDGQTIIDGFNRAVVNEMARRWNVPVSEAPDSAGAAGIALLQSGDVDLLMGVRADQSLYGQVTMSQAYYSRGIRLIHLTDVPLFGIGDLEFKDTIAAPPIDVSEDLIRDNNSAPRIQVTESFEESFNALTSRTVYGVVGDEYALFLMAQIEPRLELDDRRYRPLSYTIGLAPDDIDFQALVNFTLQNMALDGTLERLAQQYLAPYVPGGAAVELPSMEVWPGDGSFVGVNH